MLHAGQALLTMLIYRLPSSNRLSIECSCIHLFSRQEGKRFGGTNPFILKNSCSSTSKINRSPHSQHFNRSSSSSFGSKACCISSILISVDDTSCFAPPAPNGESFLVSLDVLFYTLFYPIAAEMECNYSPLFL
jgi:hypothetical protein